MLLLKLMNYTNCSIQDCSWFLNASFRVEEEDIDLYPISLVVPFTFFYVLIFIVGIFGNVSTCVVIIRNKSMQNATNAYLFSLACSDLLLLLSGLPPEMYRIWSPDHYTFGEGFCIMQGFFAETSANATVLTITLFTVERYLAICHPFLAQTMSTLSRAVKSIVGIWIIAVTLAIPQAIQFGLDVEEKNGETFTYCTLVKAFTGHAFEISTFLIFVVPMLLITILYVLIGIQLRKAKKITAHRGSANNSNRGEFKKDPGQRKVIHMLIAVVVAFFICWAPFHAQRLLAVYLSTASDEARNKLGYFYLYLMYISGVLYFVSTTVNPVLYHIMSKKFRKAFKDTFQECCCGRTTRYSAIRQLPPFQKNMDRTLSDGEQQNVGVRRTIPAKIKDTGRSDSKISDTSRSSFLSDSSRGTSDYDKHRIDVNSKHSGEESQRSMLTMKFHKIFGKNNDSRGAFVSLKGKGFTSSLKDTEITYCKDEIF